MPGNEQGQKCARVIALDYGKVHTGVAISDPSGTIATPLGEIADAAGRAGLQELQRLVSKTGAGIVIVGLPVSLSGRLGPQAQEAEKFAEDLRKQVGVPVILWDERFTSKIAGRSVAVKKARRRDSTHSLAASLLLDDYLRSAGRES